MGIATEKRRILPLIVWVAALGVGTALFHSMGDGPLEAPPLSPSGWGGWVESRNPMVASVAVLRLVALGISWYLVGATTIGIVARLFRAARLVKVADALTVPSVRRILQGALGMSLATAMVTAAAPSAQQFQTVDEPAPQSTISATINGDEAATVTLASGQAGNDAEVGDAGGGVTLRSQSDAVAEDEQLTMATNDGTVTLSHQNSERPLPLELIDQHAERFSGDEPEPEPEPQPEPEPEPEPQPEPEPESEPADDEHEVAAGESLWSIARDTLSDANGEAPSDAQVTAYWQQLIDENQDRLEDPDNPDLIFPGQNFKLPAVGA